MHAGWDIFVNTRSDDVTPAQKLYLCHLQTWNQVHQTSPVDSWLFADVWALLQHPISRPWKVWLRTQHHFLAFIRNVRMSSFCLYIQIVKLLLKTNDNSEFAKQIRTSRKDSQNAWYMGTVHFKDANPFAATKNDVELLFRHVYLQELLWFVTCTLEGKKAIPLRAQGPYRIFISKTGSEVDKNRVMDTSIAQYSLKSQFLMSRLVSDAARLICS